MKSLLVAFDVAASSRASSRRRPTRENNDEYARIVVNKPAAAVPGEAKRTKSKWEFQAAGTKPMELPYRYAMRNLCSRNYAFHNSNPL